MPAPRQPQDHKSKTKAFSFVGADGKTYRLPHPSKGVGAVPGRALRDAAMEDDERTQLKLGLTLLEAGKPPKEALDALYDLPGPKMLEVLRDWMNQDGVSLGESQRSSK